MKLNWLLQYLLKVLPGSKWSNGSIVCLKSGCTAISIRFCPNFKRIKICLCLRRISFTGIISCQYVLLVFHKTNQL